MRVVLIANTKAGGYRDERVEQARRWFARRNVDVQVCRCVALGDSARHAREAVDTNADLVAVGGGDGTINEIINVLAGTGTPMALLPMGSVNVLALEVGIPADIEAAAAVCLDGVARPIALGCAGTRHFALMASVGFDAEVVYRVDLALKARLGIAAYPVAAMNMLLRPDLPPLTVKADGHVHEGAGVVISNARLYGGSAVMAPDADIETGELSVCIFRRKRRRDLLRYALAVARGNHLGRKDVHHFSTQSLEVLAGESTAHVQVDGDVIGHVPMSFSAREKALTLMVPRGSQSCVSAS